MLFLTARDQADNRVKGFVAGGDDYLTKPFSVDELAFGWTPAFAAPGRRSNTAAPSGSNRLQEALPRSCSGSRSTPAESAESD